MNNMNELPDPIANQCGCLYESTLIEYFHIFDCSFCSFDRSIATQYYDEDVDDDAEPYPLTGELDYDEDETEEELEEDYDEEDVDDVLNEEINSWIDYWAVPEDEDEDLDDEDKEYL